MTPDPFWSDLFHCCAWAAYLEVWHQTGQFPPDSEATRRLAYQLYEDALAEKNAARSPRLSPAKVAAGQIVLAKPSPPALLSVARMPPDELDEQL